MRPKVPVISISCVLVLNFGDVMIRTMSLPLDWEASARVAATLIFWGKALTAAATDPSNNMVSFLILSGSIPCFSKYGLPKKPVGGLRVVRVIVLMSDKLA